VITYHKDVPEWMRDALEGSLYLFGGFNDWKIEVRVTDDPGGDRDWQGACGTNTRYRNATIELHRDLKDDDEGRTTVVHEALELAHAQLHQVVYRIIDESVPEATRPLANALYNDARERFIEHTARGVVMSEVLALSDQEEEQGEDDGQGSNAVVAGSIGEVESSHRAVGKRAATNRRRFKAYDWRGYGGTSARR
jgi:hypothetical protein